MPRGKERVQSIFLGGFGLILGALMLFTLVFEDVGGCAIRREPTGQAEVSVVYPEAREWRIFARGAKLCLEPEHGLGRLLEEKDDSLLIETAQFHRPIRFTWHGIRGESQARELAHTLIGSARPPIAIVGSSNTVLTVALARQLQDDVPNNGPLLLVPWATSVSLLDLYPGRTFRFCSNNRRAAELLVDCHKAQPSGLTPRHVVVVIDQRDPYSIDLAGCFIREVRRVFPQAEIQELAESVLTFSPPQLSALSALPSADEQDTAKAIWRDLLDGPRGETLVFLPLQSDPARRLITALNGAAPAGRQDPQGRRMTVVSGDALGKISLLGFINQLAFPVWTLTTTSDPSGKAGLEEDVHEQAEVAAALLIGLDTPGNQPTVNALRETLLHPTPEPPRPFGRPLAFTSEGERSGFEPGGIFCLRPGSDHVEFYPSGRWTEPQVVHPGGVR